MGLKILNIVKKKIKARRLDWKYCNMRPLHPADITRGPFPVKGFEARKILREFERKIQDMKRRDEMKKTRRRYRSIKKPATFLSVTLTDAKNAAKKTKTK